MGEKASTYHHGSLREALLEETTRMIAEGGASSVTLRALSQRLGVSRAAPYRHFDDRASLLVAVAADGFGRLERHLQGIVGSTRVGDARFHALGEAYVRFALDNPAHYRLMFGREVLRREDIPELRNPANALLDLLVQVIGAHQKSGGLKRQDARQQAYVAWSAVHGLASLLLEKQIDDTLDLGPLIRQTTQTLLDGLHPRS